MLIVLGGPIGVYEADTYPFLERELELIATRVAAGSPIMGICLGAQLIAAAAGAKVGPTSVKEIGFAPINLTEAGIVADGNYQSLGEACRWPAIERRPRHVVWSSRTAR